MAKQSLEGFLIGAENPLLAAFFCGAEETRAERRDQGKRNQQRNGQCRGDDNPQRKVVDLETPLEKGKQKKGAIVVRVAARTATKTSLGASTAARSAASAFSRNRRIFSKTTIELSTNRPKPRASAPRVSMLIEILKKKTRVKSDQDRKTDGAEDQEGRLDALEDEEHKNKDNGQMIPTSR